jgi:hypothetical protein
MSTHTFAKLSGLFISFLMVSSCEYFLSSDEKDKLCKDNTLSATFEGLMILDKEIYRNDYPDAAYNLCDFVGIKIEGILSKVDCWGDEVDHQTVAVTITQEQPAAIGTDLSIGLFPILFTNNMDYVSITYTMTATFADGKKFKSQQIQETTSRYEYLEFKGLEHTCYWKLSGSATMVEIKK